MKEFILEGENEYQCRWAIPYSTIQLIHLQSQVTIHRKEGA